MESSGDHGRLLHVSPSYASVFSDTVLESLYVGLEDISALRPALPWALAWRYGGTFVAPNVVLTVGSFDSFTNFVCLDVGSRGSRDLFRFEEARHKLPLTVLDHFSAQGNRGLNLSLSNEEWTRIIESYCKRRLIQVKSNSEFRQFAKLNNLYP